MYTDFSFSRHLHTFKHLPIATVRFTKPLTKLFDVTKPLELWGVNDFHQQWMEHKGSMDGIIEQLCVNMHNQWDINEALI